MAITKEIWRKSIEDVLFQSNAFLSYCTDLSEFYDGAKTVHVPNAGAATNITKNPATWPLASNQRTDVDLNFTMNTYATDLFRVGNTEEVELSYNKMNSIIGTHARKLADTIGNQALIAWAPSATTYGTTRIFRTTGAASATTLCTTATGYRSCITAADILRAKGILDQDLVPSEGRILEIPSAMHSELLAINEFIRADAYGNSNIPTGVIGYIYGIKVMPRPNVLVITSASTPALVAVNDAGQFTGNTVSSCYGAMMFHPDFVAKANGPTNIFAEAERADFQGSIMSANVHFGASLMRYQSQGVAVIAQNFVSA